MKIAVVRELFPGERRVALVPINVPMLAKAGAEVIVQAGAGLEAGFTDAAYIEKGATVVAGRTAALSADIILQVRAAGMDDQDGQQTVSQLKAGQIVIGSCDPLGKPQAIAKWASSGVTLFALELIPRITRAQSMDILSSQATIAGYRAVLIAASSCPSYSL